MTANPNGSGDAGPRGVLRDDATCRRVLQAADYYEVLGAPRSSDELAVKTEFRRRAREVHPDKNSSPLAAEAFKRVQKAYEVLSDAKARRRYDACGEESSFGQGPRPYEAEGFRRYSAGAGFYEGILPHGPCLVLMVALLPMLISAMMSAAFFLVPALLRGDLSGGSTDPKAHAGSHRRARGEEPSVVQITGANIEEVCGSRQKRLCVVLLTKPGKAFSQKQRDLVERLRSDAADNLRNSRGQILQTAWVTTPATGRWASLLPSQATLPWFVVLKPSAGGARVVALPVPRSGGRQKRRLSEGVPELLQEIALGSARFKSLGITLKDIFRH